MQNALHPNLLLLTVRNPRRGNIDSFFVSNNIVDKDSVSPFDNATFFPLYIYPNFEDHEETLFPIHESVRQSNFAPAFIKEVKTKLGLEFVQDGQGDLKKTYGPEDVFYYAYAVFHSPTYRSRYAEFLKIDFPRLPLTSDKKLFAVLVAKGKELVELHLLKSAKVEDFVTTYPMTGENRVEKVTFVAEELISRQDAAPLAKNARVRTLAQAASAREDREPAKKTDSREELLAIGKVWINPTQYFGNVPEAVWGFKIGGYQVCDKWLKDRKGRTLSGEEISHYQRVVVSLKETMRLMNEIDQVIPRWPME